MFGLERAGIKYNLKNINVLLKLLGNPEKDFKSVHIAGTNGKGSVSSVINSILIEKGFRTGLYTSPHIIDFRERILVNGIFIGRKFILNFFNEHYDNIENIKPSFFEITTALAFKYFSYKKINYAVIETGLGGRLDSTNVLLPVLSIITSIGIDHTEFLGNTLKEITIEKAGIIKNKIPVVIGSVSSIPEKIFKKIAKEKKSEIIFAEKNYNLKNVKPAGEGFYFDMKWGDNIKRFFLPLIGDFQKKNIKTALASVDVLAKNEKIIFTFREISEGLAKLKTNSNLHGRFELISKNPKIVIDVSHNLQGLQNIKNNLKYFRYEKLFIIFGMMKDKQYKESIDELSAIKAEKIILTKPDYKRAAEPDELYEAVTGREGMFETRKNIKEAFEYVTSTATIKDLILITGSFFLVGDFLKISKLKPQKH